MTEERTALVTGASRGLGAAIAIRLGTAGFRVAVNFARDAAGAAAVVAAIRAAGGQAVAAPFDATDPAAVRLGVETVAASLGPPVVLVSNATGPQPVVPLAEQTWQHHLDQLRFFVHAPLLLVQACLGHLASARTRGRVINIGSEVVDLGNPGMGHYVAAKAAMVGLTRSWANELGAQGTTVNLVAPGWIPVERHAQADPAALAAYRGQVPLGRQGLPEDVADAVAWLASDGARFVTGQTLAVNGGRTLA